MKSLRRLSFVLALPAGPAAAAESELQLSPVMILNDFMTPSREPARDLREPLTIAYRLPCGWRAEGFYLREVSADELAVGVIAKKRFVACLGMEKTTTATLPLKAGGYKIVRAITSTEQAVIGQVPTADRAVLLGSDHGTLKVLYRGSNCVTNAGIFIAPRDKDDFQVGVAEPRAAGTSKAACHSTPRVVSLRHVTLTVSSGLDVKRRRPVDLFHASMYAIAVIDPPSLHRTNNETRVDYFRRCNEAPVGLVITEATHGGWQLGVLVARFYNVNCPKDGPKRLRGTFTVPGLKMDETLTVTSMPVAPPRWDLSMTQPAWFRRTGTLAHPQTTVGLYGACDTMRGVVVTGSRDGAVTVAGLATMSDATCTKDITISGLSMPAVLVPGIKLMPLRLAQE